MDNNMYKKLILLILITIPFTSNYSYAGVGAMEPHIELYFIDKGCRIGIKGSEHLK
jgi:hypothetical protein